MTAEETCPLCGHRNAAPPKSESAIRLVGALRDAHKGSPESGIEPGNPHFALGWLRGTIIGVACDVLGLCPPCSSVAEALGDQS